MSESNLQVWLLLALFFGPGHALRPHTDQAQEIKYAQLSSDNSVPLSLTHFCTNSLSRHIHREEAEEVDRVKRDVNVNTVEKDIRYLLNTSFTWKQN